MGQGLKGVGGWWVGVGWGGVDVGNGLRFGWEGGQRYTFCFLG